MTERFMVDDAGTLIDMHTRDTFNYVSDVCSLLNNLHEENQTLKTDLRYWRTVVDENENQLLEVMSYLHDNHYEIWEEIYKITIMKYGKNWIRS